MIPDASKMLSWLKARPHVLKGIRRGIERETLRVTADGTLATTPHPKKLGSALTHHWITTDFAEALLEFITPVDGNIEHMLEFLRDIHRYVARNIGDEMMWPFSMPCFIDSEQDIELAQYGSSNIGKMKTLYREGLKNRYGALMQTISGVHYNFSLPSHFWQEWPSITKGGSEIEHISSGYFRLIRNYYRFGWVIPYLFGASPAVCSSFLQGRSTSLPFQRIEGGTLYLPYATSLRLSDLGYTNNTQSHLGILFNNLQDYVKGLKKAIATPSPVFIKLNADEGEPYRQLNGNLLQIENELYAPIRPKRVTKDNETPSDALLRGGVEYIEVRSLDINPFSPIGVDAEQARFLDLFLIWCLLADAAEMDDAELLCSRKNWNKVILEGRKPGQTIRLGCDQNQQSLSMVGHILFSDLKQIAEVFDYESEQQEYQRVCDKLILAFDTPELTFSARILKAITHQQLMGDGVALAERYRQMLIAEPLTILDEEKFEQERERSLQRQKDIEASDTLNFDAFIRDKRL